MNPDANSFSPASVRQGPVQLILWVVLALCVARLWLMPLPSSFWADETATAFVVHHGADDPSLAVAPQVPDSIYYVLPKAAEKLLGFSEAAYRLPSVLVMLIVLVVIGRLGAKLIHPTAGWMAVFTCLALQGFNDQAADARPYGLGTCIGVLSLWFLIRWLDWARWGDAVAFVVMGALLWRIHLIFWPFYLVLAVYAVARLARRDTPVRWLQAAGVFLVLGLLLVPVIQDARFIYRQAPLHVIAQMPTLRNLAYSLHPGMIAGFLAGAALLARWRGWLFRGWNLSPPALALMLGWWLSQPICLFLFSWITGNSLFVKRYLFLSLPGAAFLATAMAVPFIPDRAWKPLSAMVGIGVLALLGTWNRVWPEHRHSRMREAALAINKIQGLQASTPIICLSPFVEARIPAWNPEYSPAGFLYAQLDVYPLRGRIYPFPLEISPAVENYAASLANQVLPAAGLFVIYGSEANTLYWRDWFAARPELAGWKTQSLGSFGDLQAIVLSRRKQ
jgi:hypothetical protein